MSAPGEPTPVVLVPGLDGTGALFGPFVDALGAGWQPCAVRYRPGLHPLAAHVDDVLAVVNAMARPLLVVAESFGGPVSVAAAAARPDLVKALCLVATFVTRPDWSTGFIRPFYRALTSVPWPPGVLRVVLGYLLAERDADPALMRALVEVNDHRASAALSHRIGLTARVDQRAALQGLRVPVGYIAGSGDRIVPVRRHAAQIRQLYPRAVVEMIPGAPHMLLQLRPRACATLVDRLAREAGLRAG